MTNEKQIRKQRLTSSELASNDNFSLMVIGVLIFYGFILITSLIGNIWVLVTCYRNLNRNRFSPMWYVANLAFADLLFTFLTPFHAINFSWRWVGGDVICKLHAFLVDTSYNTSITTLVVIAYLRLKAITDPFNSRGDNFSNKEYIKIVLIWCMCLVISSPTASMNKVETNEDGKLICTNTSWGSIGREIYYTVHAILFFIIPLIYMIVTQGKIFRSLRANVIPMCNSHIINTNQRHKKVAKTLAALSLAFFSCQSPFMILRLLKCFNLVSPGLVWRAAQLMIFLNVALDPLLYGYYGENLKSKVRRFLRCN
ncbi:neuropeptide Y receptor type 1-like [Pocillopora damicornis]|uniref:neuropeptide Y receptor type 1-like n=1 Tax=Pocillopora damicornis TaxID=46731 RepID=UPI000F551356|nr:neuropeptide Y receptor type 1-like [Pocillopora damicornis]